MKRLTKEQGAIISAFTGILCGEFSAMREYCERIMGRPIFTHEFASKTLRAEIKEKAQPDFLAICHTKETEGK